MKAEDLKQEMIQNIDRPEILERLYRNNHKNLQECLPKLPSV
jgi:hypothetical protein